MLQKCVLVRFRQTIRAQDIFVDIDTVCMRVLSYTEPHLECPSVGIIAYSGV